MAQYSGKKCGYGRTKTYESLRVARALPNLPECTALFDQGELAWSTLYFPPSIPPRGRNGGDQPGGGS